MSKNFYIFINSLNKGGAERVASDFSFFLESEGFTPVFFFTDSGSIDYEIPSSTKIKVLPLSNFSRSFLFPLVVCVQAIFVRLRYGSNFDAISFLHRANLVNALSGLFTSRSIVVSERSIFSKSYSGLKKAIMKILLQLHFFKVDKVIAISKLVKKELVANFNVPASKITIVYNPIDEKKFFLSKNRTSFLKENALEVCVVGRLISSKRVRLAMTIFKESLLCSYSNAKLHIIGDGIERINLEQEAKEIGINHQIVFHGSVTDVGAKISTFDLLLFTSRYESFGNVALEATSVGLPVIYTDNLESLNEIYTNYETLALSISEKNENHKNQIDLFFKNMTFEKFLNERSQFIINFERNKNFTKYLEQLK